MQQQEIERTPKRHKTIRPKTPIYLVRRAATFCVMLYMIAAAAAFGAAAERHNANMKIIASPLCPYPAGVQAIIFDCDGVLVDSEGKHAESWVRALKTHGVNFTPDDYRPFVGHDADFLARHIASRHPHLSAACLARDERACYRTMQGEGVTPIAAATAFVRHLAEQKSALGVRIGLASTSSRVDIAANLVGAGISDLFDTVVSGRDDLDAYPSEGGRNKPKPYIYLEAARRLNVAPEHCLAFEDTPTGVAAARAAGMQAYAVPNDWTRSQDFSAAHHILSSLNVCDDAWLGIPWPPLAPELAQKSVQTLK